RVGRRLGLGIFLDLGLLRAGGLLRRGRRRVRSGRLGRKRCRFLDFVSFASGEDAQEKQDSYRDDVAQQFHRSNNSVKQLLLRSTRVGFDGTTREISGSTKVGRKQSRCNGMSELEQLRTAAALEGNVIDCPQWARSSCRSGTSCNRGR